MTTVISATTSRRGRPRDPAVDAAILDAAVVEIIERGMGGLSMEAVAARAGVAKTTVYRRWASTADLALDAMRSVQAVPDDPPAGTVRDQLTWLLDHVRRSWNDPRYAAMMRRAVADANTHPDAYRAGRERLIRPTMRRMDAVIARGVDEGVIRRDVDPDWVRRMLVSPILAAAFTLQPGVTRAQIAAHVDLVLRGVTP